MGPDEIVMLLFFGAVCCLVFIAARYLGYFSSLEYEEPVAAVSFLRMCIIFSIYIGSSLFLVPALFEFILRMTSGASLAQEETSIVLYGWLVVTSLIISSALVLGYVFLIDSKGRSLFFCGTKGLREHVHDIYLGVISWAVSVPFVQIVGQCCSLVILYAWGEVEAEQAAISQLKELANFPIISSMFIFSIICIIPVVEEVLFRGYLQNYFRTLVSRQHAIIGAALVFSLFHFTLSQGIKNIELLPSLFVLGCFLGFLYERQRSLLAPIALHMTFNAITVIMLSFFSEGL